MKTPPFRLNREVLDSEMIKRFLEGPDDIALVALGPIVVTGFRLQELDPAKRIIAYQKV